MITIQIKGLDELLRITSADLRPTFRAILHGIGELVRDQVARAPGPVHKPIRWASAKQRRYVMALVRQHGPWVRESHALSQRLIASWTVRAEGDMRVVVGNRTTYGPWVQDATLQQPMHRATGWMTDERAKEIVEKSGDIDRIMGQAIEHFLEGGR